MGLNKFKHKIISQSYLLKGDHYIILGIFKKVILKIYQIHKMKIGISLYTNLQIKLIFISNKLLLNQSF